MPTIKHLMHMFPARCRNLKTDTSQLKKDVCQSDRKDSMVIDIYKIMIITDKDAGLSLTKIAHFAVISVDPD